MSEDQAFYEHCNTVSADAPKPSSQEDRLWEIFGLGTLHQFYAGHRLIADDHRDKAAKIIKELCTYAPKPEIEGWIETASRHARNEEFYRGLLDLCAEAIGIEAYTADDDSITDSPVRLKIPGLVKKLTALRSPEEVRAEAREELEEAEKLTNTISADAPARKAYSSTTETVLADAEKPCSCGQALCPDEVTYLRYEALRRLNPRQFEVLWKRNLAGENFDAMVDELVASGTVPADGEIVSA